MTPVLRSLAKAMHINTLSSKELKSNGIFHAWGDREAEQTSHFNYLSIRNQMSIAHQTLSLTALAAVILKRSDKIRCFRSFADAA